MSNVRNVIEGRLPRALAYVFDQLALLGAKSQDQRLREPQHHQPLTPTERIAIRRQLRRDLRASLELCSKKTTE